MTLKEMYIIAKGQPKPDTPANAFIKEVAAVAHKTEVAVRRWLTDAESSCYPDDLTQEVIARHFNTTPSELFPPQR